MGALNPILGLLELHHRLGPNNLDFGVCDFLAVYLLHFQFWTLDFESRSLDFGSWTLSFSNLSKSTDMSKVQNIT